MTSNPDKFVCQMCKSSFNAIQHELEIGSGGGEVTCIFCSLKCKNKFEYERICHECGEACIYKTENFVKYYNEDGNYYCAQCFNIKKNTDDSADLIWALKRHYSKISEKEKQIIRFILDGYSSDTEESE